MRTRSIATLLAIMALTGCVEPQPQSDSQAKAPQPPPAPQAPSQPQAPLAGETSQGRPPAAVPPLPSATTSVPVAANPGDAAAATPRAPPKENAAGKSNQPPAPPSPPQPRPAPPPFASTPAAPLPPESAASAQPSKAATLDLAGLTQRLRDTNAIGIFTKLSLKNQVDDLLEEFRGFYNGQVKVQLPELRQRYELLLLKVVTLLQDADQPLAKAVASSREAIWNVLADPQEFSKI